LGESRYGIFSLIVFFIVGIVILTQVDEKEGMRVAEEENAAFESAVSAEA